MKHIVLTTAAAMALAAAPSTAGAQQMSATQHGDTVVISISNPTRYLILPIEEDKGEKRVMLDTGHATDTWMDVRLSEGRTDYCVPLALGGGTQATVRVLGIRADSPAVREMRLSNDWDVTNTDYYRPLYHHTPPYGWMNDANGMVYKDGEYHLYFQYNPYGSKWGNMHWGHSVSRDLIHWEHLQPAIARDTMGHIFSGSSVVDKDNTAGFGAGAIVAIYTNNSDDHREVQCIAYSNDNGRTFTKYAGNPVLTPFDGLKDFRDPKVFWHEPTHQWYMIVSADKEMRFYTSPNLKEWTFQSGFGKGWGAQPNQFECPDFFQLPLNDGSGRKKYVMIVNINPGCLFGGSATEYFVGDFDGKTFSCDADPKEARFLDYGKDHYATVTFSNTGDRVIAVPWMSNWQYANVTPFRQNRGANALPRELSLFSAGGHTYVAAGVAPEAKALRRQAVELGSMRLKAGRTAVRANLFDDNDGAFEIEADVTPSPDGTATIDLANASGEHTRISIDMRRRRAVMDRSESGVTDFGALSEPHGIEKAWDAGHSADGKPLRQQNALNYKNDFALATWAPLTLCDGPAYHVDIWADRSSIELFVDGGRIAMTNLVFPTSPYNTVKFGSEGGQARFDNVRAYKLGL